MKTNQFSSACNYISISAILLLHTILLISLPTSAQTTEKVRDSLPERIFSINEVPINICFIKEANKYVGFIIAGHAQKAVCESASFEVATALNKIGYQGQTVFTYGVGFDLRINNWTKNYDSILAKLEIKLKRLAAKSPFEINVSSVSADKYLSELQLIRSNFLKVRSGFDSGKTKQDRIVIKYNEINHPLIVPFYRSDTIVKFKIDKASFNEIPSSVYYSGLQRDLRKSIAKMNDCIAKNGRTILRIDKAFDKSKPYTFYSYYIHNLKIDSINVNLGNFPPPPEGYVIKEIINDRVVSTRPITFAEAKAALNDPSIKIEYSTRKNLQEYIKLGDEYQAQFNRNKSSLRSALNKSISNMRMEIDQVNILIKNVMKLQESENKGIAIDAFLRGWLFEMQDSVLNDKIDDWYKLREIVWKKIVSEDEDYKNEVNPFLDDNDPFDIAGIFQNENVFFAIQPDGKHFIITPYQVIGNTFFQVIDRQAAIPQMYTLHNFRTLNAY